MLGSERTVGGSSPLLQPVVALDTVEAQAVRGDAESRDVARPPAPQDRRWTYAQGVGDLSSGQEARQVGFTWVARARSSAVGVRGETGCGGTLTWPTVSRIDATLCPLAMDVLEVFVERTGLILDLVKQRTGVVA